MANITLLGASYTDVPAVDLPKTGGGTVRFYENGGTNQDYEDALVALGVQSDLADSIEALTTYANGVTGESDTNLSDAVHTLGSGYGGSDQSLIKSVDLTMSETYTNNNKLTVALEPRTACVILGWADELPPAPESGYTAFFFSYFIATGISKQQDGRIMRANGTVGTDSNMFGFNTTTGDLTLGGQYGYFRQGMTYHIRQYEF